MKNLLALFILSSLFLFSCGSEEQSEPKTQKKLEEFKYKIVLEVAPFESQVISKADFEHAESVLERRFKRAKIDEYLIQSHPDENKIEVGLDDIGGEGRIQRMISAQASVGFYEGYEMMDVMMPFIENMVNPYIWQHKAEYFEDDTLGFDIPVDSSMIIADLYEKYFPVQSFPNSDEVFQKSILFRVEPRNLHKVKRAFSDSVFLAGKEEYPDLKLAFDMESLRSGTNFLNCYALKIPFDREELITDKNIESVRFRVDATSGENVIDLKLDESGTKKFSKLTSEKIGKVLFLLIGDEVVINPVIQTAITDGKIQISGNFTIEKAKELELMLGVGAFPFQVSITEIKENK